MPRLRISALSWICVLGKRPPFTKKIFTPSSSTASPTIANVNNTVAIICIFKSKPVPIIATMQPSIARRHPVLSKKTCKVSDTLRLSARFFANIFSQHPFKPLDLTIIQSDKGKLTLPLINALPPRPRSPGVDHPRQCIAGNWPAHQVPTSPSVYCRPVACMAGAQSSRSGSESFGFRSLSSHTTVRAVRHTAV